MANGDDASVLAEYHNIWKHLEENYNWQRLEPSGSSDWRGLALLRKQNELLDQYYLSIGGRHT